MEKRTDLLLSTLRHHVQGIGGRLDLVMQFPDQGPVILKQLGGAAGNQVDIVILDREFRRENSRAVDTGCFIRLGGASWHPAKVVYLARRFFGGKPGKVRALAISSISGHTEV